MNRTNTIVWILLLVLTGITFTFGGRHFSVNAILFLAAVKAWLVARHFMELRNASAVWTFAMLGAIGTYLLIGVVLT